MKCILYLIVILTLIEKIRAGMESASVGGENMPPIKTVSIDSTMKSLGVYPYLEEGLCRYMGQ